MFLQEILANITPCLFALTAVVRCVPSIYIPTHAPYISHMPKAMKQSQPVFCLLNAQKSIRVNYNLRQETTSVNVFVLFTFCNPTNIFDGNWNGTPIIACKSNAQLSYVFRTKLCTKVRDCLHSKLNMITIILIELYLHSSYNTPTIPTHQRQIFWDEALAHKPV